MEEKEVKEIIQDVELRLNAENKAKLKSLKIFENQYFQISNGWTDLVYELGKNIEDLCKLANCELPQIEYVKSKYSSLRFDYYYKELTTPIPQIVEKLIDSLIYEVEDKSEKICMFCGSDGAIDEDENGELILKSCKSCSKTKNLTTDEELVQALVKAKKNRENWYADELLEDITRIQENVKNKELSKLEYISMLNGIVRKINKIKEKINYE